MLTLLNDFIFFFYFKYILIVYFYLFILFILSVFFFFCFGWLINDGFKKFYFLKYFIIFVLFSLTIIYLFSLFFFLCNGKQILVSNWNSENFKVFFFNINSVSLKLSFLNINSFFIDGISGIFIILLTFLMPICLVINIYTNYQFVSEVKKNKIYNFFNKDYFGFRDAIDIKFSRNNKNKRILCSHLEKKNCNNLYIGEKSLIFVMCLLFLELVLFYFFLTTNLFTFYVLFEASVIPIFFMIGTFGSRINRIKAAYYLFFFTVFGSIFFLIGVITLIHIYGSSNILFLASNYIPEKLQLFLWILFFIPMAVKVPIFPFHIWLPEAHVEASTEGSIILAGLLLKIGLYGIIRIILNICPQACLFFTPVISLISICSIIYISFTVFIQIDLKKIIAYSSIIHMNFALLGIFSNSEVAIKGSIFLMFTHGIISSGMFMVVGFLYARYHTRLLSYYQGLFNKIPIVSLFFFLMSLGNAGMPGTGGFVGEILIFIALLKKNFFIGIFSSSALISGAILSFLVFTRIFYGNSSNITSCFLINSDVNRFLLISKLELSLFYIFILFLFITGLFPNIFLDFIFNGNILENSFYFNK